MIAKTRITIGVVLLVIFSIHNFINPWEYAQIGHTGMDFLIAISFQVAVTIYSLSILWIATSTFLNHLTIITHKVLYLTWISMFIMAFVSILFDGMPIVKPLNSLQDVDRIMFFFAVPIVVSIDKLLCEVETALRYVAHQIYLIKLRS